jgi:hypothetical protein
MHISLLSGALSEVIDNPDGAIVHVFSWWCFSEKRASGEMLVRPSQDGMRCNYMGHIDLEVLPDQPSGTHVARFV